MNPYYLTFYLSSDYTRKQTDRRITGLTTRDRTVLTELRKVRVLLPDVTKQNLIMKDINSKMHESKSAFVEFENTVANINSYFDRMMNLQHKRKKMKTTFVANGNSIVDRRDCYANPPDYGNLISQIRECEENAFLFKRGRELEIVPTLEKKFIDENNLHLFNYLDIGNTSKKWEKFSMLKMTY